MCIFVELSKKCYFCTMKCRILVVEDDASFGMMIQTWLKKNGYEAVLASRYEQAKIEITNGNFGLILTDLRLPDGDGIILMTWVREKLKSKVPIIVMTGYAEVQTAVSAMKLGAFDYLKKPINPSVLEEKIAAALASTDDEVEDTFVPGNKQWVKGNSPAMVRLYKHVELVAPTKFSVLILGESGTGKEYIARMIHEKSQFKEGPFIPVDCGSLSKELAPSELFGHLKGSFTSAIADKKGVFEQAKGGTVFLDEVGNLPYEVQMQLLRALQEQKVRPVGSATDIHVDVRIIAATNENLEQAIEEGRFRQDLFHRINEFAIEVPPLRDRLEDFDELTAFFIRQANEDSVGTATCASCAMCCVVACCLPRARTSRWTTCRYSARPTRRPSSPRMRTTGHCVPSTRRSRSKPPCRRRGATRPWLPNCCKSTARPCIIRCIFTE